MSEAPPGQLLAEFDALVEAVEGAAVEPTWRLADWIAGHLNPAAGVTLAALAERSPYSPKWLGDLARTATRWPPAMRVAGVSVKVHGAAYQRHAGDLEAARAALEHSPRLRDHGPMESVDASLRHLGQRSAGERARAIAALLEDAEVAEALADTHPGAVARLWKGSQPIRELTDQPDRLHLLVALRAIRRQASSLRHDLEGALEVGEEDRARVLEEVGHVRLAMDAVVAALSGRDWDAALASLERVMD